MRFKVTINLSIHSKVTTNLSIHLKVFAKLSIHLKVTAIDAHMGGEGGEESTFTPSRDLKIWA
jgi:hypothetical protein